MYFCTSWKDLNKDKKRDLICFINMKKTGLTKADSRVSLKASFGNGMLLVGSDSIKVLGNK